MNRRLVVGYGAFTAILLGSCAEVLNLGALHDEADATTDVVASEAGDGMVDAADDSLSSVDASDANDASDAPPDVADCQKTCSTCSSCLIPGKVGVCSAIPKGVDDKVNSCLLQAVCDGKGACLGAGSLAHFGEACVNDTDCYSGVCGDGACKIVNGQACAEDAACKSGRCVANVCAACATGTDCASGVCNAPICLGPGGFPCATGTDCASSTCTTKKTCVQTASEACTAAECITHFCGSNSLCQTCSKAADCPLQTPCTGGACLTPAGAYCHQPADCASNLCGPAPFLGVARCQ